MRFSILLPTRNRLSLLRFAVESVRRQKFADWEIIISDNYSEEDIAGYVQDLNDPRVKYFRTESFVPVTDNWTNALEKSTGDYVLMLGDDDALLNDYFERVNALIEKYDSPDLIYSRGYIYAYPGVIKDQPGGFLHLSGIADFFTSAREPFFLDHASAKALVDHSMKLQTRFEYNMQYSTVSRKLIDSLKGSGPIFQSPFPDFYATNVFFLKARRLLVYPEPLVIIGISSKSYGFYHYNDKEDAGMAFLQCFPDEKSKQQLADVVLPGSNMNTSWLFSVQMVKDNYGEEFPLAVDYANYRALQLLNYYEARLEGTTSAIAIREMTRRMSLNEKIRFGLPFAYSRLFGKRRAIRILNRRRNRLAQYSPTWRSVHIPQSNTNILEACDFVAKHQSK